jgi:hypothetical protein
MHVSTSRSGSPSRALPAPAALATAALAAALAAPCARAGGFAVPPKPPIGTDTVATADLLVKRPPTTPCVVTLFSNHDFVGFSPYPLAYVPPAGCPGPWAKVVLQADFNVTAGRQFDRTAAIDVGGVNLYFGTTMEPGSATPRAWHVERDVTDYAATLKTSQAGEAILYNLIDQTYTGHILGSASLAFYPPSAEAPAAKTAQTVLPLASSLVALSPANPQLTAAFTLPTNVERLYLDVIAQSQANDEFWYSCVPDAFAGVLQSCGGGPFREIEIAIDGTPAGVAPIFPWIYTGGISPYLWFPTPGVQTLDFRPARIDLTPFAGQFDDGHAHAVTLQVYGAQDNFSVTGTLMAWSDPGTQVVTGGVTTNTLAAPVVNVDSKNLRIQGANAHGRLQVSSGREFTIAGTVNTSHGPVTTTVATRMNFVNTQHFDITAQKYVQNIDQRADVKSVTTTTDAKGTATRTTTSRYPLTVGLSEYLSGPDIVLDTAITQELEHVERGTEADGRKWVRAYDDTVTPKARTTIDQVHGTTSVSDMTSAQHLFVRATGMGCYDRTITVAANAVTAVDDRCTK